MEAHRSVRAGATIALRATGQPREAGSCEGIDTVELLRKSAKVGTLPMG